MTDTKIIRPSQFKHSGLRELLNLPSMPGLSIKPAASDEKQRAIEEALARLVLLEAEAKRMSAAAKCLSVEAKSIRHLLLGVTDA